MFGIESIRMFIDGKVKSTTRYGDSPLRIQKDVWEHNGKGYEFISDKDFIKALDEGKVKVNCCPFCKLENNKDVHTRGGSWASDSCPECGAVEYVAHEFCRNI